MPFEDYAELVAGPIVLPINGKAYTVPAVPAADGVELLGIMRNPDPDSVVPADRDMQTIAKLLSRPLIDEMMADAVPFEAMYRAAAVQMADLLYGREAAEAVWTGRDGSGVDNLGEASAASQTPEPEATETTSSDEASTTP